MQKVLYEILIKQVENAFIGFEPHIVEVSAGFDTYLEDWGGPLKIEDYRLIGRAIQQFHEGIWVSKNL